MLNKKYFAGMFAAAMLGACSTPVQVSDSAAPAAPQAAVPAAAVANGRDVLPVQAGAADPLNDPRGALARRSVYFDYDSYVVSGEGGAVAGNHAAYLARNQSRRIVIQGHADERGGTEYNLALGQKRTEAVRKSLAVLGVAESQMEAVSLGESKPAATGATEAAWAKNRRADIVY